MKTIIFFILALILIGCHVPAPTQVPVHLEAEVVGLADIPLTNMPGHAYPEIPLECICPKMFGLDYNPCCTDPKIEMPDKFMWYEDPIDALTAANGEKMILVSFYRDLEDVAALIEDLYIKSDGTNYSPNTCVMDILDEHYVGLLIENDERFYNLIQTSRDNLKWLPKSYVQTPALSFIRTYLMEDGYTIIAEALPITFEGKIDADMCVLLTKMWQASRNMVECKSCIKL